MENNSTEQGDLLKAYCPFPSHNNGKLKNWSCLTAQPKTRKLRQVYWHLATDFLYRSWYQDAFTCLSRACCELSTDFLQVHCQNLLTTGLLQVLTSCNKSGNDKLQQAWFWRTCCDLMKLKSLLQLMSTSFKVFMKRILSNIFLIELGRSVKIIIQLLW